MADTEGKERYTHFINSDYSATFPHQLVFPSHTRNEFLTKAAASGWPQLLFEGMMTKSVYLAGKRASNSCTAI